MKLEDFEVGMRVVRVDGLAEAAGVVTKADKLPFNIALDNGETWIVVCNPESWEPEIVQPEAAQVIDWSYAEAQRLADAADAAIEAYNEYIEKQPKTMFIPKIK